MRNILLPCFIWLFAVSDLQAAGPQTGEEIPLWPQSAAVTLSVQSPKISNGPIALLVIADEPKAADRTGADIGRALNALGITTVSLKYSDAYLRDKKYNKSYIQNYRKAFQLIRKLYSDSGDNNKTIGVIGVLGGAAIAEQLALQPTRNSQYHDEDVGKYNNRPDFLAIISPKLSSPSNLNKYNNYIMDNTGFYPKTFIEIFDDKNQKLSDDFIELYKNMKSSNSLSEIHFFASSDIGLSGTGAGRWAELLAAWLSRADGTN